MVNQSKINDSRFWEKWNSAGAVADRKDAENELIKREDISHYRHRQSELGNLSDSEVSELERFEFRHGPSTVDQQVRLYYLRLKSYRPDRAEKMVAETSPLLEHGITNESDVEDLCKVLYQYWSGFLIRYNNVHYTMTNNEFQRV